MNDVSEKLRKTRILAIIGLACMLLGTIFTYVKIDVWFYTRSISLVGHWEGIIVILLAAANILFIFKDFVEKYIPALFKNKVGEKIKELDNQKLTLIPTAIVAILAICLLTSLDIGSGYTKYGLGFYMLWIGIVVMTAYAFAYKKD